MTGLPQADFTATTTVVPGDTGFSAGVAGEMDAILAGASAPGITVNSVAAAQVLPVCGNNVCETGELCGATDDGCCIRDCPTRRITCPTKSGSSDPCSGQGTCDYSSGECSCFADNGYTGDACDECATGFLSVTGRCTRISLVAPPSVRGMWWPCVGVSGAWFSPHVPLLVWLCAMYLNRPKRRACQLRCS